MLYYDIAQALAEDIPSKVEVNPEFSQETTDKLFSLHT